MLKNKLAVRIPNTGAILDIPTRASMTAADLVGEAARLVPHTRLDCAFSGTRPLDAKELVENVDDLAVSTRFIAG